MDFTPNLNLPKPVDHEDGWGDEMRAAMDSLDAGIGAPIRQRIFAMQYTNLSSGIVTLGATAVDGSAFELVPVNALTEVPGTIGVLDDPAGWGDNTFSLAASDPTNTWGEDYPEGSCVMLPPGVYTHHTIIGVATASALSYPTVWAWSQPDQVQYDPDFTGPFDGSVPWFHPTWWNPMTYAIHPPRVFNASTYITQMSTTTLVNDTDTEQPFSFWCGRYNSATPLNIILAAWFIYRIGGLP